MLLEVFLLTVVFSFDFDKLDATVSLSVDSDLYQQQEDYYSTIVSKIQDIDNFDQSDLMSDMNDKDDSKNEEKIPDENKKNDTVLEEKKDQLP